MLQELRRGVSNLLAKALLALLVVAFVGWGVADVFRTAGQGSVAQIGKTEIGVAEFQQAYQDDLAQMSQQFGRRLTPDQARMLGVEGRTISRLIGSAAIDAHVRELNLALSDDTIAAQLRNDPALKGPDGKFNRVAFDAYLRQNGLSEARFLAMQRRESLRDQVTDSLLADVTPPKTMLDTIHRYREETRRIEFVTLDPAKAIKIDTPDEARLLAYYEQNKARFMTPENRKLAVLLLTRDDVKKKIAVSDDDLKATYEADKEKFNVAERRRITQIAFPDRAAAEKAYAELAKAKSLADAIAKLGFKDTDIDLGLVARRDMIDSKIAEAAFALKKDELSRPVEGLFSTVLLRVSEIQPGKQRTLDEVRAEIGDRLATERATREIQTLHDDVENSRASGKTLKETAEKLALGYREVAATDAAAKAPDGKPAFEHPDAQRIVQKAFGGSTGVEADAIELADGGYAWFDVLGTMPAAQRAYDIAKADVTAAWTDAERRQALNTLAAASATRLTRGEAFATVAKEFGGKVETTAAITRATSPQGLTANAVQQAFALPKGAASSAQTADSASRTIFRITEVTPAAEPTKAQADKLRAELTRQMQGDLLAGYVAGLQARYGVTINDRVVRQALGQDRQQ